MLWPSIGVGFSLMNCNGIEVEVAEGVFLRVADMPWGDV
jgi:hypothetical protein